MRYLIFSSLILFMACRKDDYGIKFFGSECMNGYRMPYTKAASNINFVEAKTSHFGPLRLVSGYEGDTATVSVWQTIATTGPTLQLNGNYPVSKLVFKIGSQNINTLDYKSDNTNEVVFNLEKYSKKQFSTLESQIDSSIQIGALLLNKSKLTADTSKIIEDNFAVDFLIGDCNNIGLWNGGFSGISEQAGTLECTEFNKTVEGDKIRYKISLKFDNVTLRSGQDFMINDGKMVLDFKIPR
jgi:hypothetical protein